MSLRNRIRAILSSPGKRAEIVRYVMVGGLATVIQYVCYLILVTYFATSAAVGAVVSYGISFVANFFLSNYFTFQTKPNARKAASFAASHLINLGLQTGLTALFAIPLGKQLALLPAMAICIPVNYLLVRYSLTGKALH